MLYMDIALVSLVFLGVPGNVLCNSGLTCSFESGFCDWTNEGWIRQKSSGSVATGPQEAHDGSFFVSTDITIDSKSTLKGIFQKASGTSCLNFRFYYYGPDLGNLEYGYYSDSDQKHAVHIIQRGSEQFWYCSTFDLSSIPDTAKGVYFEGTCKDGFSIIALDNIIYTTGSDCNTVQCSQPSTTITTSSTQTPGSTPQQTQEDNDLWIIIGGSCAGLVLLVILIIVACVVKRRNKNNSFPPSYQTSQANRQLPPVPQNVTENGSDVIGLSIAESFDRKFSMKPEKPYYKNHTEPPKRERPESQAYIDIAETKSIQEKETDDDNDYVQVTPDYSDDENENYDRPNNPHYVNTVTEKDEDYLEPTIGLDPVRALENQYESDPTEKNKNGECAAPSMNEHSLEIPEIPIMNKDRILKLINENIDADDDGLDYDDATAALDADSIDMTSEEGDYDNNSRKRESSVLDYEEPNQADNNSENEDYLDVTTEEDYITPTTN